MGKDDFCFLIQRREDGDGLEFEFPEDEDRALAAWKLSEYTEHTKYELNGNRGYFRDIFLGTTSWKLYSFGFHDDMILELIFKESKHGQYENRRRLRSDKFKMIVIEGKSARIVIGD